jgi:hypothetical protein
MVAREVEIRWLADLTGYVSLQRSYKHQLQAVTL